MFDDVLRYVSVPGAISACITLLILGSGVLVKFIRWSRTEQRHRENLLRLACGTSLDRFEELLGRPLVTRRVPPLELGRVVHIYRSRYSYVFATAPNKDDSVDAFSITVRRDNFKLSITRVTNDQLNTTLPKTSFLDIIAEPNGRRYLIGANRLGYAESYYLGNPGNYQTYVLAFNDIGAGNFSPLSDVYSFSEGQLANIDKEEELPSPPSGDPLFQFREKLKPNTLAVVGADVDMRVIVSYLSVGVDKLDVIHIPE